MHRPQNLTFRQFDAIRRACADEHGKTLVVEKMSFELHDQELDEVSDILGIDFVVVDRWQERDIGGNRGEDDAIYTVSMRRRGRYAAIMDGTVADAYYVDDRGNVSSFCGSLPGHGDTASTKILRSLKAGCTVVYDGADGSVRHMQVPMFQTPDELRLKMELHGTV